MSKKIFCYIPDVCLNSEEPVAAQVRAQLKQAIENLVSPTSIPRNTKRQTVQIDEPELQQIEELALRMGMVQGKLIGGLLYAQHLGHKMKGAGVDDPTHLVKPVLEGLRVGQSRVLQQVAPLLRDGKLVFSECGTGTGKARLIAHAAAYLLDLRDRSELPSLPEVDRMLVKEDGKSVPDYLTTHIKETRAVHAVRMQRMADSPSPACVVACAPTIENLAHLVSEWIAVRPAVDERGLRRVALRLGRGQFVNLSALQSLLDEADPAGLSNPRTRAWFKQMPAGQTAATRSLLAIEPGLRGLMVDLMTVANEDFQAGEPWIDVKGCALSNDSVLDDEDDSTHHNEHMRRYAEGFDILYTTTAMVCLDNLKLRDPDSAGLLPATIAGILVDEGHQLESIQANLASRGLSLSRVLADLKKLRSTVGGAHAEKALENLLLARTWLSDLPNESLLPPGPEEVAQRTTWNACLLLMREAGKEMEKLVQKGAKKSLDTASTKAIRSVKSAASVIAYATSGGEHPPRGVLEHSPVRGYISMNFGPSEVNRHLMARWSVTPCAMIFSGTLFHISASGTSARSAAFAVGAVSRYAQTDPLHPSWLYKPVEFLQPSLDSFHRFMPPKREEATENAMRGWLESVAQVIARASTDAGGGMLVLMTGYQRLSILEEMLKLALPATEHERVMAQKAHTGTSVMAEEFRVRAQKGLRPIWLATGAAWTGLDLSDRDVPAEQDFLLTDLVVPAAPFGLERSTTHIARLRRLGFVTELMGVQQKLRQGFGRLVRREGVTRRRIWLLDGRLVNPATAQRFADVRRAASPYLRRASIG